jgi:signal transduction histidine kinase
MELFILRIIQESLSNAIKYSRAATIKASIEYSLERISFSVEDNGIGFDLLDALETKIIGKRSGIRNMKQRAQMIAGTFEIFTSHNSGTKIKVNIDLNKYNEKINWIGRRSQITT